jgi:hypothetical protein
MMLVGEDVQDRWLEGLTDDALTLVQSLAEAGLLDGCEATTHWSARSFFQRCYPRVLLRAERILVPSGAEHRLVTSGGSTSWTDLALYLVARFCGDAEARHIAKIFLFGDRSDGQLPFAAMVRPAQHEDAVIAQSQTWIADNYAVANPVAAMVHLSSLNDRTFKHRFKAATGYARLSMFNRFESRKPSKFWKQPTWLLTTSPHPSATMNRTPSDACSSEPPEYPHTNIVCGLPV